MAARLQVTTNCSVLLCQHSPDTFQVREHSHIPCVAAAVSLVNVSLQVLPLNFNLPRFILSGNSRVANRMESNNADGVCPGDALLEVQKFKTLVLSTCVHCVAHLVPWVYLPPWRQTHYSLLRETGKCLLRQLLVIPLSVSSDSHSCPSTWSRVLPSPLLLVI